MLPVGSSPAIPFSERVLQTGKHKRTIDSVHSDVPVSAQKALATSTVYTGTVETKNYSILPPQFFHERAIELLSTGKAVPALKTLKFLITTGKSTGVTYNLFGACLLRLNKSKLAYTILSESFKKDPSNSGVRFHYAEALFQNGFYEEAIYHFTILNFADQNDPYVEMSLRCANSLLMEQKFKE